MLNAVSVIMQERLEPTKQININKQLNFLYDETFLTDTYSEPEQVYNSWVKLDI